jgi:hypothetical protein
MNRVGVAAALLILATPPGVRGQVVRAPTDTVPALLVDSAGALSRARAAQARFERRRLRYLPITLDSYGGSCDEHVGRFCSWYDEGDWFPIPEREEIRALRAELLETLAATRRALPGDGWVLGERVWYLSEEARWPEALGEARACRAVARWWCSALEGFALHGLGRYRDAEAAFGRALRRMDEDRARSWRLPERAVDAEGRAVLRGLRGVPPDSATRVLDRLWMLADPLYLVEGNDRLTAHYARWTVSTLHEHARNPFHISWGRDLEELTVRHGWELGWERSPDRGITTLDNVVGHKHPEGRDFMPSGRALLDPGHARPEELRADRSHPRSLYAPAYAPILLPMEGQLAVFPRGRRMVVVATTFLPEDTTVHATHAHDLPWLRQGGQPERTDRAGLFLLPVGGGAPVSDRITGRTAGALWLELPVGAYLASAEAWSPRLRRAGRFRVGISRAPGLDDVASLSDLVLLRPSTSPPETLRAAVASLLPRPRILPGQSFALGWEVTGLGFRTESLRFSVSVVRRDRGLLHRLGSFLRLSGRGPSLELSWEEPAPAAPGPLFRAVDLNLPDLDPGAYEVVLSLRIAGREELRATRVFEVRGRG